MSEKKSMMAISIAKSICKEYSTSFYPRVVYLENDKEFQIQLFNPHNFTIGAEIFINDEKLSNRLVLKPGERIWLERYLDVKRKFKFSTYEVEGNNKDVQEAIKDNGKIEVKFYKEMRTKEFYPSKSASGNTWWSDDTFPRTIDIKWYNNYTTTTGDQCDFNNLTAINCSTTSNLCNQYLSKDTVSKNIPDEMLSLCETGRIETGSTSNQEFNEVNLDFEYLPFVTEQIKLLPLSQKPFTVNDLHKIYCSECGRKLKSNYKFCPFCGSKID